MLKPRFLAPATLLLAVALAACGGTAASPGAASPDAASPDTASPAASDAGSPSAAASDAASPDVGASGSPAASADTAGEPSADTAGEPCGDLIATLPATVGDLQMSATEVDPQTFIATNVNLQLTPMLAAIGRSPSDLEVAVANGTGPTGTLFINAVRIQGADAEALRGAFETAAAAAPGNEVSTGQVGTKDVVTVTTGSYTLQAYATGDTMYFVQSPDPALVEAGIEALP
jgi:hypothetical protein